MQFLRWGAAVAVVSWAGVAAAGDALDKPAFTAKPDELVAAAKSATADAETIVLRDEAVLTFDDRGRADRRWRVVFVVRKQSAVDNWGTLELEWQPFYQDKPTIRARVVSSSGQVAELDPSLITDAPAVTESPSVFSDRRRLQVPLPRLAVGSVVEEEYTIRDREPLLAAGTVHHELVGRAVPVQRTIVTVDLPSSSKSRVVPRGFGHAPVPRETRTGNRHTLRFDTGPSVAIDDLEDATPGDVHVWPSIGIATGSSWTAIATDYAKLVDQRIEQGAFALPENLKGASEHETLNRASAWLHEHVRYTGIEFSDAAIVPWSPAEIAKRGFGDCKDQATMLVAILRAAGIHAHVALLSTGPGTDVDRDLPGMGDFDHAIVSAKIDGKDVWIDATEAQLPAGQLPARDQGRLALVADAGTRDLVTTPVATPAQNTIHEVRTYHLAEHDRARVTETSDETGVFWDDERSWYRDTRRDEINKSLSQYVEDHYKGKLATFSADDPADITRPFSLTVEVDESTRAFTKRRQIDIYLFPKDALVRMPRTFSKDKRPADRRGEYEWFIPHVYVIENRLVVPSGYTMPKLVPHEEEKLGTMTLTTDRRVDNDTLVITYKLETGKRRLSAADVNATRTAVAEANHREGEHVVISHTAYALSEQGKLKEAIAECRRLIAMHPKEALHHDQLADIYREAGMGLAARREARKGIEVEPRSSDAYDMLAYQLRHDSIGREYGYDMDRKGAIAAYRKALELDPEHLGALADFASLLARDDRGQPTAINQDRLEAVALWRRAKKLDDSDEYDKLIVGELLLAGSYAEAETAARAMPEGKERSALVVAAIAASHGTPAALDAARALTSERDRNGVLTQAAGVLLIARVYAPARELSKDLRTANANPATTAMMSRITAIDFDKLDATDPKSAVLLAFTVLMGMPPPRVPPWDAALGKELAGGTATQELAAAATAMRMLPRAVASDMLAALSVMGVEGTAATGWRVTMDFGAAKLHFYAIRENGKAKLVGGSDMYGEIGALIHDQLAHGDVDRAMQWMKWVTADLALPKSDLAPLGRLISDEQAKTGKDTPSKELADVAAAIMMAKTQPKTAAPILKRCAVDSEHVKKACEAFLAEALFDAREWTELAEMARHRLERDPNDVHLITSRAGALARSGHAKEAADLLDEALRKRPDELDLLSTRAFVAEISGNWNEARAWLDKELANPAATVWEFNGAAWEHLFFDPTPDDARKIAAQGERLQPKPAEQFANTIAAIEAELDHPAEAWQYLRRTLSESPSRPPRNADWYVIGRIAESLELKDDAITAYRRVSKPDHPHFEPTEFDFAARRLSHLGVH